MNCLDCGKEIKDVKRAWPEVVGFSRPRSQRSGSSGSSLVDRRPTGRVICGGCAQTRIHVGPSDRFPGQEALL